jgi:hypothetical protein
MFPSMTTSQPLAQSHIQPTLFAVDFPAKTSPLQANKRASKKALGLVSFTNSSESFAWHDHGMSCWKTSQRSLLTDWTSFSESWPRQGLMRNGHVFRQVLWEPAISATVGGLLPTPRSHRVMAARLEARQTEKRINRGQGPNLEEAIAWMLPTPTTRDHKGKQSPGHKERGYGALLPDALIPTGEATYLNPSFVEEMMGFPVGWTALKP